MTDQVVENIEKISYLDQYLAEKLPELTSFVIEVLIAGLVYVICSKLIKWGCRIFKTFLEMRNIDSSAIRFLTSFVKAVMYFLLIVMLAMQLGLKEASVIAVLGSMGVGLGLALQGGMTNLAGGVLILILKPFQLGDYIIENSSKLEGTVKKIDMFYTTLSTVDNQTVIIPNSQLTNQCIVNATAQDKRRLDLRVTISYDDDMRLAKDIIEKLLLKNEYVLDEEGINVFVHELGASGIVLGCRAWTKTDQYWNVRWKMNEDIKLAFDEAGISIPYNQLDVHVKES